MAEADVEVLAVGDGALGAAGRFGRGLVGEAGRLAVRRPAAQRLLGRGSRLLRVEVAREREHELVAADVPAVEGADVVDGEPAEAFEVGLRIGVVVGVIRGEEAAREEPAGLGAGGVERAAESGGGLLAGLVELGLVERGLAELLGEQGQHIRKVGGEAAAGKAHTEAVGVKRELGAAVFERLGDGEAVAARRAFVEQRRGEVERHVVEVGREVEPGPDGAANGDDLLDGCRQQQQAAGVVGGAGERRLDYAFGERRSGGSRRGRRQRRGVGHAARAVLGVGAEASSARAGVSGSAGASVSGRTGT